jgi:hypothetical protein
MRNSSMRGLGPPAMWRLCSVSTIWHSRFRVDARERAEARGLRLATVTTETRTSTRFVFTFAGWQSEADGGGRRKQT